MSGASREAIRYICHGVIVVWLVLQWYECGIHVYNMV